MGWGAPLVNLLSPKHAFVNALEYRNRIYGTPVKVNMFYLQSAFYWDHLEDVICY